MKPKAAALTAFLLAAAEGATGAMLFFLELGSTFDAARGRVSKNRGVYLLLSLLCCVCCVAGGSAMSLRPACDGGLARR